MKRFNHMTGKNVSQDVKDNFQQRFQKNGNPNRNGRSGERSGKGKGIQCYECEGFGHIQKECPNFLKKQKNGYNATLSDDEEEDSDSDQISNFVAFTASIPTHNLESIDEFAESSKRFVTDDELSDDAITDAYNVLHTKWVEESQVLDKQSALILSLTEDKTRLLETIIDLKREISRLNGELDQMTKSVRMLNSGTDSLDNILTVGQPANNMKGLGYTHGDSTSQTTIVPQKSADQMPRKICQTSSGDKFQNQHQRHLHGPTRSLVNRPRWVCHHCGRMSHIRPFCYRLYGRNLHQHQSSHKHAQPCRQPLSRKE